ncbi:MAG: ATP-grasp domain-containing protein [Desulfobacterales bacterium]|uniref:ATP-grasp domain-containing protein n=1 Tax=Candidatus Desulfatibia profunda TaxID=2841695 RepID=A0A8J6NMG6_9BACT|nr:ATP-grasp domain-containing protein [Candidatus Desulfatibia profunda]MBL7179816.1 ATP-grasp domain-containing protein [Desulfobacterales bacterium]
MNREVFITDGHWRKTLAAARALGGQGIRVAVGESTRLATAMFSRHCHQAVVYPSPFFRPAEFVDYLYGRMSRRGCQMLLPMEDETLDLLSRHHSDFSKFTYLPIVSFEKLRFARRKDKVLTLAEKLGIPTPKTWLVDDLMQLDDLAERLPYPVVIKPKSGSGAVGVSYPENAEELRARYPAIHRRFPLPLIQEMIPREGPGYGVSILMDENGQVKASFVHKRLREYPVTGGASTLRESVRRDDIRDMAVKLLKALDWFGVAMVEFKLDPRDGLPKLMEINPRFWGSLSLAVAAGVNFPYLLYRMSRKETFAPVHHYQIGKKARWLLPGDLLHFIHNPGRSRLLPEFFRFRDFDTVYDIVSLKDPWPTLARILTLLTFVYDRDMKLRLKKRNHDG